VIVTVEALLTLQEHDLALDRLHHRLAELPERARVEASEARAQELRRTIDDVRAERDEVAREEQRFEDEATSLGEQAAKAEERLYSGGIVSPRELQALEADVAQLRRRQRSVEDRQLAAMERREPLDARLAELEGELAALEATLATEREALEAAESSIRAEISDEESERAAVAAGIDADLVATYERCREKANGVGAARLVGMTCQGCHLSLPSTEVERIRRAPAGTIEHCDNCGCILVP